jgi:acyl-CoA thioesterase FadM
VNHHPLKETMGLVHTPRVAASLLRGLLKRRNNPEASLTGLGSKNPHIYCARVGLFDVDYLGHLNNAAYLNHAELARWEMTAYNGLLGSMARGGYHFLVAGTAIRYRAEIRPIFRQFQIDSTVAGIDEHKNIWITHNFRYPIAGDNRVRAQLVVRGVALKGRTSLDPREIFKEIPGVDEEIVDGLMMPLAEETEIEELLNRYVALEHSFREVAGIDDETHK